MDAVDTLKIASSALGTNKMRSLLTMLGVIIGVGAVIAMLAVGNGAKAVVETQIASMGTNVILTLTLHPLLIYMIKPKFISGKAKRVSV